MPLRAKGDASTEENGKRIPGDPDELKESADQMKSDAKEHIQAMVGVFHTQSASC